MALALSQAEYDDIVLGIADHQVRLANIAMIMRRQGDPDAFRREEESMMLMNILDALKFYDVDADFLTDDNVYYLHELATIISENCPI
jgi:hypothetical protein